MGKDGSKWGHGWTPKNGAAVALKAHKKPGGKSGAAKAPAARSAAPKPKAVAAPKKAAPGVSSPGLSRSYVSGKGATPVDVKTLVSNYVIMHGKPPTAKQIAKIKRAK